jgi:hypothetical protein
MQTDSEKDGKQWNTWWEKANFRSVVSFFHDPASW